MTALTRTVLMKSVLAQTALAVRVSLLSLALLVVSSAHGQTTITFWHSMEDVQDTIVDFAEEFNAAQSEYRVEPRYVGSYPEAQTRLIAAFGTVDEPVMFQAEIGFFPQLVADAAVQDLSDAVAELDEAFVADFYAGLWGYGEMGGGRYGLPWNSSTPVLYYNADALAQAGIAVPETWEAFADAARSLTTRQAQGAMFVGDSWLFEMMVLSLGGVLVHDDGTPNFDGPEAIEALTLLRDLVRDRAMAYYANTETTAAILTFIRTRNLMTFASIANWPVVRRFSVGFTVAAAPVPMRDGGSVPLGGAQLVVMRNASDAQRDGAFAFWQYLMESATLARWIEASYYIPVRRAALPLLDDFYAEDPNRGAALAQLDLAVPRPRLPEFNAWRRLLDEALERALRGNQAPEAALAEAQRRALEPR
jgi:sn-glycerol 3-phosphate transport system substrate-binding protein